MIKNNLFYFALTLTFLLISCPEANGHRIRVFAYESGGTIITEAKFNSGRPAKNIDIIVEDHNGTRLLSGPTDEQGIFRFPIPEQAAAEQLDLNIIADVGEGHRGTWLLAASDYLAVADPEQENAVPPEPDRQPLAQGSFPQPPPGGHDWQSIEQIVENAIAKELAPVKRMLAEERERSLSLQDILGGLGYIFGLAGIAAYFQAKKNGGKK